MKRQVLLSMVALVLAALTLVFVAIAIHGATHADTSTILIDVPVTTHFGPVTPGTTFTVAKSTPSADLVGLTCPGVMTISNNESHNIHSTVMVTAGTGDESIAAFTDVETRTDLVITFSLKITAEIVVTVIVGDWGYYSGGFTVAVNCPVTSTTTTSSTTTTTTTTAPPVVTEPSTTVPVAETTTLPSPSTTEPSPPTTVAVTEPPFVPDSSLVIVPATEPTFPVPDATLPTTL